MEYYEMHLLVKISHEPNFSSSFRLLSFFLIYRCNEYDNIIIILIFIHKHSKYNLTVLTQFLQGFKFL